MSKPSKVLIIGSGPIIIGQAAEFDYAGTQACKAMREEGVVSVLVNSNPATIMTDEGIADIVYIEPLTVEMVGRIIERERPDGLLPTLGGQTGLNLAVDLADAGVLDKYNVKSLGTPIQTIRNAEDRELFKQMMVGIGEPVPDSATVNTLEQARKVAKEIGLPLIIRPAYTLGGTGGGMAYTWKELDKAVTVGLAASPIHQVLLESSVVGWKEIEYEVMRDGADNCITVCNMENIDPMGVHTGDSIVVAPSQTLTNKEYQLLRNASLKIIRALGVEGGCNIQFALDPNSDNYFVIEVNPRVSRSSALASKATGYPIARVAAKIAVGKRLDEIPNQVTGKTMASFEPALDYLVVKIPRWPFDKFASGDRVLGTQMKATGEVMAIDRCFEAALQKAIRSLEFGRRSLLWEDPKWEMGAKISSYPLEPNDLRLWALMAALRRGISAEELSQHTKIDLWFTTKLQNIVDMEKLLLSQPLTPELMWQAKRLGFSDEQIGTLADRLPEQTRELRHSWNIRPVYKMVDTCAAEFDAGTPYFYSTYEQENEAEPLQGDKAIVIGSGPIRIGQGIEFDYCSVHSAWALQESGFKSIMVNSNPETVSTDFDTSDRLYFEALDEESLRDILENEGGDSDAPPSIVQFGGQTAINLAEPLFRSGMSLLGSSAEAIDLAEDRRRFEKFLSELGIPQPPGAGVTSVDEALSVAKLIGYPVLVRPSYVLGGRAMEIVHNASELSRYMKLAMELDTKHPILIDKYLEGKEVEVDAIGDGKDVLIPGIMEHIERAGVHSGDSMAVYPGVNLTEAEIETIVDYAVRIGLGLKIKGLMNIQLVIMPGSNTQGSSVYVLEVNPRSSRTIPFISKVTGVPMVNVATKVMLGKTLKEQGYNTGLWERQKLVAIKAPVFSMSKLIGVDTYLGPEMKSTGEVMGIDYTFDAALAKALQAAGLMLQPQGAILFSIADRDKPEALPIIKKFSQIGYKLYATEGTAAMIEAVGLPVTMISKKLSEGHPNVIDIINDETVSGIVNTITGGRIPLRDGFHIRRAATEKRIPCFTSLDTAQAALEVLLSGSQIYSAQPLPDYRRKEPT
ncbi:MAG: carbamoyl-phosphate synthase large subunit [Dehalococcoidales bacterium]|nr:carbamoyl-phosphate synthase large subunit [Dehalococcoidales bacterium]